MAELATKELCTGCSACFAICPRDAISFVEVDLGFAYPQIDNSRCIGCGACMRVCPVLKRLREPDFSSSCFVARTNDRNLLQESSSGGMFTELAKPILAKGGVVFGCVFENNVAIHKSARTLEEIAPMRGSKYVQSNVRDTFRECRECLKSEQVVMYTGTPCQIAGLKAFLGKDYENLLTISLICHGVASPKVLRDYLKEEESIRGDQIESINFRDKKARPGRTSVTIKFTHSWDTHSWENVYMRSFLKAYSYRESCFNCSFRSGRAGADIAIGDFWDVESVISGYSMREGASAVILYTAKGMRHFELLPVKKDIVSYESISRFNFNLDHNSKKPFGRRRFLRLMRDGGSLYRFFKFIDLLAPIFWLGNLPKRIVNKLCRMAKGMKR